MLRPPLEVLGAAFPAHCLPDLQLSAVQWLSGSVSRKGVWVQTPPDISLCECFFSPLFYQKIHFVFQCPSPLPPKMVVPEL